VADVIEALAAQDVAATDIPVSQAAARDRFTAGRGNAGFSREMKCFQNGSVYASAQLTESRASNPGW